MATFQMARAGLMVVAVTLALLAIVGWFQWRGLLERIGRAPAGPFLLRLACGATGLVAGGVTMSGPAGATPAPGPAPILWAAPSPAARPPLVHVRTVHNRTAAVSRRAPPAAIWTVRPGDNLWSIAESVIQTNLGRTPEDEAVGRYWVELIAANRSRLPDPSDPSLLFPGDLVRLPPPGKLSR